MSVRRETRHGRNGQTYERWVVDITYTLPDGTRQRIRKTPRDQIRRTAERMQRDILRQLEDGTYGKRKEVRVIPTLAEFSDDFIETDAKPRNKESELAAKRRILRLHLNPFFGQMRLDKIKKRDVDRFIARQIEADYAESTVNNHLAVIRRMLRVAVEWEIIEVAPAIKDLRVGPQETEFLSYEEADKLVQACTGRLHVMVIVALDTGLRSGELRGLQWADIDFERETLTVARNIWRGHVDTPKSHKTRRIPLNKRVLSVLRQHRHLRGPWVFCRKDGNHLGEEQESKPLRTACRRAGIKEVGWHVLRHTFASYLVMQRIPLKAVQEFLGHSDIQTTMRYAHLAPEVKKDAVESLLRRPASSRQMQRRFPKNKRGAGTSPCASDDGGAEGDRTLDL